MILRGTGNFSGNMVNMETVQMIQIVENFNGISGVRIIAYVKTGASVTGPLGVVLNHPATKTEKSKPTATQSNSTALKLGSTSDVGVSVVGTTSLNANYGKTNKDNRSYGVELVKDKGSGYYESRDTDNLYLMRQIMVNFNDNLTRSVNGIISAIGALNTNFIHYKNDSRAYYSGSMSKNTNISIDNSSDSELKDWEWLKGKKSSEKDKPHLDDILRYKPKTTDKKLYGFVDEKNVMSYGIEIIELGKYNNRPDAEIELNNIQREYSKYIRGELSCFNPPKVYKLNDSKITADTIKFGDPGDKINGAAYRFTTEVYKTKDGIIIADPGCYITKDYWLKAGVDYDIDFPTVGEANSGQLIYRFKGQYLHLGTKAVSVKV